MEKLQLKNITLVIIDCLNLERAQIALNICEKYIDFGSVKFFTDLKDDKDERIINIEKIDSVKKYSKFCIKELNNYIDTDFCLLIQYDGFILNSNAWKNDFLNYDYIGCKDLDRSNKENKLILNGGFTLRSKRLLTILSKIKDEELEKELDYGEDYIIFKLKEKLEDNNILFPDIDIVDSFARDANIKIDSKEIKSFGFHGLNIDLEFFLKENSEFKEIKKFFKNEVFFLKDKYSKILKFSKKNKIIYKINKKILSFIKKIYYKFIY